MLNTSRQNKWKITITKVTNNYEKLKENFFVIYREKK